MARSRSNAKRRTAKLRALRMRMPPEKSGAAGDDDEACAACGVVQTNKFDSTLMCCLGHSTCFRCVAAGVQPHTLCGHACNGFKYKCAGCQIWLCINKTQELAMMCGGHALARERLREERIDMGTFECPGAYVTPSVGLEQEGEEEGGDCSASSDEGTRSSSSSDYCGECTCAGPRGAAEWQLPRVCLVDWSAGQEQRAHRLARLRASLLGQRGY